MYLRVTHVKGHPYYQLVESYWQDGTKHVRVLLHLGTNLSDPKTLVKWWKFLGQPLIPFRRGDDPNHPAAVITNLEKFLTHSVPTPHIEAIKKVLIQLGYPGEHQLTPIADQAETTTLQHEGGR